VEVVDNAVKGERSTIEVDASAIPAFLVSTRLPTAQLEGHHTS
jgi:hypothetical protein